jgi:hypothetical protein
VDLVTLPQHLPDWFIYNQKLMVGNFMIRKSFGSSVHTGTEDYFNRRRNVSLSFKICLTPMLAPKTTRIIHQSQRMNQNENNQH